MPEQGTETEAICFLCGVVRSLGWHAYKKERRMPLVDLDLVAERAQPGLSPEERTSARERVAQGRCAIEANADADELTLFDVMVGGVLKREDVLELLEWDELRYDAARQRIRRRLAAVDGTDGIDGEKEGGR